MQRLLPDKRCEWSVIMPRMMQDMSELIDVVLPKVDSEIAEINYFALATSHPQLNVKIGVKLRYETGETYGQVMFASKEKLLELLKDM